MAKIAQTKLTAVEKQDLQELKQALKNAVLLQNVEESSATVLMMPAREGDAFGSAKFVRVAVAYASPTEKKNRRKVGQFLVAKRMYRNECIVMDKYDALAMADIMRLGDSVLFADA